MTKFQTILTQPGDRLDIISYDTGVPIPDILRANQGVFPPLTSPPIVLGSVRLVIPNPNPTPNKPKASPPWRTARSLGGDTGES